MEELTRRILHKMDLRRRLSWIDYFSDSWYRQVAGASAYRIMVRRAGVRVTMRQALWN